MDSLLWFNDRQAAAVLGDHPPDKFQYILYFDAFVNLWKLEIVKAGKMIGAEPEAHGIEAV
jgi:hypothetical protein